MVRLLLEHAPAGLPAGAIGERLGLAPATLSFHLKELARTGLVATRPDGRFIWYRANLATMNGLVAYLTDNCCRSQAKAARCGPVTPKPRIVARTRLENPGFATSELGSAAGVNHRGVQVESAAAKADRSCCAPPTRDAPAARCD